MAGLRNSRTGHQARLFATRILNDANGQAEALRADPIQVGPIEVDLVVDVDRQLAELIAGAFANRTSLPSTKPLRLVVSQIDRGIRYPEFDWASEWIEHGRPVPTEHTGRTRIFIDRNHGALYVYDSESQLGAIILRRKRHLDIRSFITPFRIFWNWIAQTRGGVIVHAGCVGINGRAVLIGGPSGSGKSSLSIGLWRTRGDALVADDCLWVEQGLAYPVFARAKLSAYSTPGLTPEHVWRSNELLGVDRAKGFISIYPSPSETRPLPVSFLVFPTIDRDSALFPVSRQRSTQLLVEDSMRELAGGTERDRIALTKLAATTPAYRLLMGPDQANNVALVHSLVEQ
jgi:hypothetical protein